VKHALYGSNRNGKEFIHHLRRHIDASSLSCGIDAASSVMCETMRSAVTSRISKNRIPSRSTIWIDQSLSITWYYSGNNGILSYYILVVYSPCSTVQVQSPKSESKYNRLLFFVEENGRCREALMKYRSIKKNCATEFRVRPRKKEGGNIQHLLQLFVPP
jgi:hypothetical protein